jgi:hypothetical protein
MILFALAQRFAQKCRMGLLTESYQFTTKFPKDRELKFSPKTQLAIMRCYRKVR